MEELVKSIVTTIGTDIIKNEGLKLFEKIKKLVNEGVLNAPSADEVRFSIAYLFRIKVDNKYLLIEGNRINQYQPVGGVYKYYDSFKDKLNKWGVVSDDNIPIDQTSDNDLRVKVPKKNVIHFIEWFESGENREACVFREFNEEILKEIPNEAYLFHDSFCPEFIRRDISDIQFSEHFQCYEVLIADIFDIKLNLEQEVALKELAEQNENFRLCTYDEIKRNHFFEGGMSYTIGKHAIKTLEDGGK